MANEKRLIDVEQAKSATYQQIYWSESVQAAVRNFIVKLPTVDAVEVVHGRWKRTNWQVCMEYTCPFCGYKYSEADPAYSPEKYCCKCGARNE